MRSFRHFRDNSTIYLIPDIPTTHTITRNPTKTPIEPRLHMHTGTHSTQDPIPQIGDMLQRLCGTVGVVEHIDEAHVMHVHLLHSPKFDTSIEDPMRVPAELIGVTWQVLA